MGKFSQDIVEMHKIVNDTPFDAIWVYWETDIYYNVINSTDKIVVRTHDKVLTNCEASLIATYSIDSIPIGTYSVGTYSNPNTLQVEEYQLIVGTVGYITDIYRGTYSIADYIQLKIPKDSEIKIEWTATENQLYPFSNPIRPGGYGVYATYSSLTRRDNNALEYWLTTEYGTVLTDDEGNILTYK